jgi:hypothetical protein
VEHDSAWLIASKIYLTCLVTWVIFYTAYLYLFNQKSARIRKGIDWGLALMIITSITIMCLAPLSIKSGESIAYVYGPAVDYVTLPVVGICVVLCVARILVLAKTTAVQRLFPAIVLTACILLCAVIRLIDESIIVFGLGCTLVVLSMYLTIENPDRKFLEKERLVNALLERADKTKDEFVSIA